MRKLAQIVYWLYPRAWRERYGVEFNSLLDDLTLSWHDVFDILRGGLIMRITRSEIALVTLGAGVFGAVLGGIVGWRLPPQFKSSGVIHVQMWSPSPSLAAAAVEQLASKAFSSEKLKSLIEQYDLYPEDQAKQPVEDIIQRMRRDIHVQSLSGTTFQVSFTYPNREKAQQVTLRLMEHLDEAEISQSDDWKLASMEGVLTLPNQLNSTGVIEVRGATLSPSPALVAGEHLETVAYNRETLKQFIESQDLYREDRGKQPMEVVIQKMRHDIRIEPRSSTTLQVSFVYPDRRKAQQVATELMKCLMWPNARDPSRAYDWRKDFTFRITGDDLPNLPQTANPTRIKLMGIGLGGGLLLGLTVSLFRGRLLHSRA